MSQKIALWVQVVMQTPLPRNYFSILFNLHCSKNKETTTKKIRYSWTLLKTSMASSAFQEHTNIIKQERYILLLPTRITAQGKTFNKIFVYTSHNIPGRSEADLCCWGKKFEKLLSISHYRQEDIQRVEDLFIL